MDEHKALVDITLAAKRGAVACLLWLAGTTGQAWAQSRSAAQVDSEHLFGFTQGSDIGDRGELEGESDGTGRLGKRFGTYAAVNDILELKYSITDYFRVAPNIEFAYHDVSGVPGFEDRRGFTLQGAGVEFKYRLLNRAYAPFGLTIAASPYGNGIDTATGGRVGQYGIDTAVIIDKELVKDRIYGAFNVLYEPKRTHFLATGEDLKDAIFGIAAALTSQVRPGLFLGGEVRHLRSYQGLTFDTFAGEAWYLGPTLYAVLSAQWNLTFAWNAQVSGHATGDPRALDLVNFDRHQVRLRLGYNFPP
jgi:hypothetical protein